MSERLILWGIVIAYMVFIFVKGVSKARSIGSTDDFLIAGRNVRWFMLFCTMGATVIGGGYSIGAIAKTYEWGILMLLVSTGGYLHFIFSGLVVAPQFREAKLYTVAGYFGHRFGEQTRFLVLLLSLLFSVFIVAAQMAAFGTVLAAILPDVADSVTILRWAILSGGMLVVIYSTAGGLMAVIHTDLFQFLVLMGGFVITLIFCIPDIARSYNPDTEKFVPIRFGQTDISDPDALLLAWQQGEDSVSVYIQTRLQPEQLAIINQFNPASAAPDSAKELIVGHLNWLLDDSALYTLERFTMVDLSPQSQAGIGVAHDERALRRFNLSLIQDAYADKIRRNRTIPPDFFKLDGGNGWVFLITTFLAFLLGETFAPGYATRYCIGRNIKETKLGIAGVGFFLAATFPVVLFFIALYARIHYPGIDPQQALPMVVRELHSPVIGGIMIGAVLMAVMSSADSALNSSTAIFVKDLFEHQLGWKDKGDGKMLRLARWCTAGLGIAAVLIAVLWSDIIGLLLFTYHVWAPAIIVPVTVGALYRRRSKEMNTNIFITMIVATIAALSYRGVILLHNNFDISLFGPTIHDWMGQLDTAVFGVGVSVIVFTIMSWTNRAKHSEPV